MSNDNLVDAEFPAKYKRLQPIPRREILEVSRFDLGGDFKSYYAATHEAKARGYGVGPACRPLPTAIIKGFDSVANWKNLSREEKAVLDGFIVADSFREGPVFLVEFGEIEK